MKSPVQQANTELHQSHQSRSPGLASSVHQIYRLTLLKSTPLYVDLVEAVVVVGVEICCCHSKGSRKRKASTLEDSGAATSNGCARASVTLEAYTKEKQAREVIAPTC